MWVAGVARREQPAHHPTDLTAHLQRALRTPSCSPGAGRGDRKAARARRPRARRGAFPALGDGPRRSVRTLRLDVHRVLADDEAAVALATYTATRPDRSVPLENNLAHVITMRDGKIAESWLHSRDQYEVDAFRGE
ncbi:nuclear transport factor 2 family protein [Streptosporangium sp. NPDC002607]